MSPAVTIDCHVHLFEIGEIEGICRTMEAAGLDAVNIAAAGTCRTREAWVTMNPLGMLFKALHPGHAYFFGGLDYFVPKALEQPGVFLQQARSLLASGADGMKMLEGKPTDRKATGVPLDAPVYDEYFRYLESARVPVLYHVADPETFWDPQQAPPNARKNGWFYGDGTFPAKEQLYTEMEGVLRKFPRLTVIFAHFYFLSADVERAAQVMDTWPNVHFDLTPGSEMYVNFRKRLPEWRGFFKKYRRRIMLGTDNTGKAGSDAAAIGKATEKIRKIREFLESPKELGLEPEAVAGIFGGNFARIAGWPPKPPAVDQAAAYSRSLRKRLAQNEATRELSERVHEIETWLGLLGE